MAEQLKVIIFMGSVRQGRFAERVAKFVQNALAAKGNFDVEVFDPEVMKFELLKQPLHFYKDQAEAPQWIRDANERIKKVDGFLVISPEYNCTIPPALTNMMDHFPPPSYSYKPTGIVSYSMGNLGGARATVMLRPFLAELGTPAIPSSIVISKVQETISEDGANNNDVLQGRMDSFIDQFTWYTTAFKEHKKKSPPK